MKAEEPGFHLQLSHSLCDITQIICLNTPDVMYIFNVDCYPYERQNK